MVIDLDFWRGKKVFLTGHTGFKGAWACLLLHRLGAQVTGFALKPESPQGIFTLANVGEDLNQHFEDVQNLTKLRRAVSEAQPEIVIHMAAQALVRHSYADPVGTYATNVMGTVNLLEAARGVDSVQSILVVTSDKCYENVSWPWGYRETDALGGYDPYSNSKACAELVASAYKNSFFNFQNSPGIATARAGNVIGGGDWSQDRLIPDAVRAFSAGKTLMIRNPSAVRPWQHVLDPILGYLLLSQKIVKEGKAFAEAWNFGPASESEVPVSEIISEFVRDWGQGASWEKDKGEHPHEASYLKLDCSKSVLRLGWKPVCNLKETISLTGHWYRKMREGGNLRTVSLEQIEMALDRVV